MAQTVCVVLNAADGSRLEAIASDRNRPRKYVDRARVVLASVGGQPAQWRGRLRSVARWCGAATTLRRSRPERIAAGQDAQSWQAADPH
jgi:hypothetical protein